MFAGTQLYEIAQIIDAIGFVIFKILGFNHSLGQDPFDKFFGISNRDCDIHQSSQILRRFTL